ncbi:MAG: thermosome subunit alpha [Halobacteriota archaeon]|nr:thermosome subunit alpha [Halobacteriota archaeon]
MAGQLGGTPILILRAGSERTKGREAQDRNILAAKTVASAVRTTLGPKGMDKMLVDSLGDVVITNDGATILKEMDIEHPAAKMMVEVAKTQDDEVGDGTTTAVVLAGELLKKSEELLEQDVHPTLIASGYAMASEKACEILNDISTGVKVEDEELLKKLARTAITGKGAEVGGEKFMDLAVNAVLAIVEEDGKVNIDNINVEKKTGASADESQLIEGMAIDKERVHPNMPKKIEDAKIALINAALEIEKTEIDAKIEITSPDQLKLFLDEEEKMLKEMAKKISSSGANVVFCQKGIDDLVQHYLAKEEIIAARRVKKSDMDKLARATGGRIVTNVDEIEKKDLGKAGIVEERKIGDDQMIFVEKCKNPKAVSILLRGGTEHVVDELERGLHDALRVVGVAIEDKKVLAGGGSPEIELALRLRDYASTIGGREQLAIEAFSEALEAIPRTLAENAGLDPIDMLVALRSSHEGGSKSSGLDVYQGKVVDMSEAGVLEPLRVKTQSISSATEVANMILRIDDVIASSKMKGPSMPPGGMGGYGGEGMEFD